MVDTIRPTILYETGLPPRYYVPAADARMDLLTPTDSQTGCPYKGVARYWALTTPTATHDDLAWAYDAPLPESAGGKGLLCFYYGRVDLEVDGVASASPRTQFC